MITKFFINERIILFFIIANSIIIFLGGFSEISNSLPVLSKIDNVITLIFLLEAFFKIKEFGLRNYFLINWNKFDFILVLLALPSLFVWWFDFQFIELEFLLIFRVSRVFKFFRFIKFIPKVDHIIKGIGRASKASILILLAFFIFNFTVSLISCYLFKNLSPEYFENPLISFYSIFKIFTVEGWYEIPDEISSNIDGLSSFFVRLYFIVILFFGGVFGLSIVNSIFVDAMVSDNNDELESKVLELESKIDVLIALIQNPKK